MSGGKRRLRLQSLEQRRVLSITPPVFDATRATLVISGSESADTVIVSESVEDSTIIVQQFALDRGLTTTFSKSLIGSIEFFGYGGNDQLTVRSDVSVYAEGGLGADILRGGSGPDILVGGEGNDVLQGNAGNDQLVGLSGRDLLQGGDDADYLDGGSDNDLLYGEAGDDDLHGGTGRDRLEGGDGQDELQGGEGDDTLFGGRGDDRLRGDAGADVLHGQDGDDLLLGGDDDDLLNGQNGNDELHGDDGNDLLYAGDGNDKGFGGPGRDRIEGGDGDDQLEGQDGDDLLFGRGGRDLLFGNRGNDTLRGGEDDDLLYAGEGHDLLYGETGRDRLEGGEGEDYLEGGDENDLLYGGSGRDRLVGGEGGDVLYGQDDNDFLQGGNGLDVLFGGAGDDQLVGGAGNDLLYAGSGNDLLDGQEGHDRLEGQDGDDYLEGGAGNDYLLGGQGRDYLLGGAGDDLLRGQNGSDTLEGDVGNDLLFGDGGADKLQGGVGNDLLYAGDGDDELYGGQGTDRLEGQDGNDYLEAGDGDDHLYGGEGADQLLGGNGRDFLRGQNGADTLRGDAGVDVVHGDSGDDQLFGGEGGDYLYAGDGSDLALGGLGDDWIEGGDDKDFLQGDDGNDRLYGNAGDDRLYGNAGNDRLLGGAGDDLLEGGPGRNILLGGDDNDHLVGGTEADALVGGRGEDQLFADGGTDILIGGEAIDTLFGGNGEDILIGASTDFDSDPAALSEALAVWDSDQTYAERVSRLSSHSVTVHFIPGKTVEADLVSDHVYGESGHDWFVLSASNPTYNPLGVSEDSLGQTHGHHGSTHATSNHSAGHSGTSHHGSIRLTPELPGVEGFALIDSIDQLRDAKPDEAVHSLLPHSDSPLKRGEHLRLFRLVEYADVTHAAVASGSWFNPATWEGGRVPEAGARVLIPVGAHVMVDDQSAVDLGTIRVDGTLSFSPDLDSELRVDTVVVTESGQLIMGSEVTPISPGVTARLLITDNGPIDRVADPFALGRGLVTHGAVEMHGAVVTPFATAANVLKAGARTIHLGVDPVGWKAGDEIVIAGTAVGGGQDEVRRIQEISGREIAIEPLSFDHLPLEEGLSVHIANLSRNVVVESASQVDSRRGHVMFMHNRDVRISHVAFNGLGRSDKSQAVNDSRVDNEWRLIEGTGTNPRGRYSVHFHRNGLQADSAPAVVRGSVVNGSPGWGFVNHSSYVDISDSVSYGVDGAAFVTEAGDEIGVFDGNLALSTTGTNEAADAREGLQDFGFNGDGFWLQGPGVSVTNNVVAGAQGTAFFYYTRGLRSGGVATPFLADNLQNVSLAGGQPTLAVDHAPIEEFQGNIGYSSGRGLVVRYHLRNAAHKAQSVLSDSTFWNNEVGVHVPYTHNTVLSRIAVLVDPAAEAAIGVDNNAETQSITYDRLRVEGYEWGILLPTKGDSTVQGGRFANRLWNLVIKPADSPGTRVLVAGEIDFAAVGGSGVKDIAMHFTVHNASENPTHVFNPLEVRLRYGDYLNHRLYFREQRAEAVPFRNAELGLPGLYVGLTQAELSERFAVSVGGEIAPVGAVSVDDFQGVVAEA